MLRDFGGDAWLSVGTAGVNGGAGLGKDVRGSAAPALYSARGGSAAGITDLVAAAAAHGDAREANASLVKRLREGGEIGVVGSENVLSSVLLKTAAPGYGGLRRVCCRRADAARGDFAARRNAAGAAMTGAPPLASAASKPLWDWSSEGWDAQVVADAAVKASAAGPWNTTVPDLPAANVAAEAGEWAANASAIAAAEAANHSHPTAYPRGAKVLTSDLLCVSVRRPLTH